MDKNKIFEENHSPVVIGNYAPFRLVLRETDKWAPTIEQINFRTYDYVKLARLSAILDIGIAPFSLGITFDGSLVLPATKEYLNRDNAVKKFNETLGILSLGGVYCEAVHPMDISFGALFFDGYLKVHRAGLGGMANFHQSIRLKDAGALDVIKLMDPQTISNVELANAYKKGKEFFNKLNNLSPELFLNGASNYVKNQWIESLVFTWTAIEQTINIIWDNNVVKNGSSNNMIEGRKDFLKDFRTWTTAAKVEMLYQKDFISPGLYRLINSARRARNGFIHTGKGATEVVAKNSLEALFRLMSLLINNFSNENELNAVYGEILKNQRGKLYEKRSTMQKGKVKFWKYIPALPGDSHWNADDQYEIIKELILRPLKK